MKLKKVYVFFDGCRAGTMEGDDAPAFFFSADKESYEAMVAKYKKKGYRIQVVKNVKEMTRKTLF
jgi:hypothetical protein